jgi:hypothetical protein
MNRRLANKNKLGERGGEEFYMKEIGSTEARTHDALGNAIVSREGCGEAMGEIVIISWVGNMHHATKGFDFG